MSKSEARALYEELAKMFEPVPDTFTLAKASTNPKVYIFGTVETATAFKLTAFAFGYDAPQVKQIGSAVVMPEFVYASVTEKTYAIPAAMVCEVVQ